MSSVKITVPSAPSPAPSDALEKRHHKPNDKGFQNPWPSFVDIPIWKLVVFVFSTQTSKIDTESPNKIPTVRQPTFLSTRETPALRTTWLGHACHYVEFPSGLRILFDPVFTDRCSPFTLFGPKRYTKAPAQISDLPFVDIVVLSHNHYDHLSHPTLKDVIQQHPDVHFFVPLGVKAWFDGLGFGNVTELDWWEEREVELIPKQAQPVENSGAQKPAEKPITAKFSCLPAQHMSARTAFDKASTLWSSWAVQSGGKKVWFAGDTAYRSVPETKPGEFDYDEKFAHLPVCPAHKQIGELHGPFDLGLIPIGAYSPRHLMSPVHANPYDAVNIFVDSRCKHALGIHWGTWVLTDEAVLEPKELLQEALKWKSLDAEGFQTCDIGESREYS